MSLNGNAVIPVLFFNTLISSLIFVPFILLSFYTDCLDGTMVYVPRASLEDHVKVLIKAVIVLSSWISGYFALKHLPLTITGPIKASQPVLTLLGAMLLFGERLNLFQWVGVLLSIAGASWNPVAPPIAYYTLLSSTRKVSPSHSPLVYRRARPPCSGKRRRTKPESRTGISAN